MKMDKRKAAFRQAISCLPPDTAGAAGAAGQAGGHRGITLSRGTAAERKDGGGRAAASARSRHLGLSCARCSAAPRSIPCIVIQTVAARLSDFIRRASAGHLRHQPARRGRPRYRGARPEFNQPAHCTSSRGFTGADCPLDRNGRAAVCLAPVTAGIWQNDLAERVGALFLRPRFHCRDCGRAQRDCRSRGRCTAACGRALHGCDGRLLKMAGGGHAAQNHVACPARS